MVEFARTSTPLTTAVLSFAVALFIWISAAQPYEAAVIPPLTEKVLNDEDNKTDGIITAP